MIKEPVLVIMAAGMGSRYGGLKQIDPIDEQGHIIMDFSIYDAVRAGFKKVVFIIKPENEKIFRETIISCKSSHNLVLIKTLSGCGGAAGEAVDSIGLDHVVGTVAGDNTMLVVVDDEENVPEIIELFDKMLRSRNKAKDDYND